MEQPTDVRAACANCGQVEVDAHGVSLIVFADLNTSNYSFRCPECQTVQVKPANAVIARLLFAAGVEPISWRTPLELREEHRGPPINYDDLLDLVLALHHESPGIIRL